MIQPALSLLSLNIERDKHYDTVIALLELRNPEVICLQEIKRDFCEHIADRLGYTYEFVSMGSIIPPGEASPMEVGVMIGWKNTLTLEDIALPIYHPHDPKYPIWNAHNPDSYARILLVATLHKNGERFRFGTTHFTWTHDGSASDIQRADMQMLLSILEGFSDKTGIVFCGDFNAPRGGEIFAMMSARYQDNLPVHVVTTLDQKLHRAAPILLAVDSIFSTKEYVVSEVEVVDGVSDHVALFAQVARSVG